MCDSAVAIHSQMFFDSVSDVSTEGDDCYQYQSSASKPSCSKNSTKNKAKSSLCRNFS